MRRVLIVLVAAFAALLAGCGDVGGYAAKVNGTTISRQTLDNDINAILDNPDVMQALEQSLGPNEQIRGAGRGTADIAFAVQLLQRRINAQLIHEEVERRDLRVTSEDLEQAREQARTNVFGDPELFDQLDEGFREDLVRQFAETAALQRALAGDTAERDLRRQYEAEPERFAERCVSHILVETREQADAARARIAAGTPFAEVATSESRDPGSASEGGALGCLTESETENLVAEFREAMVGLAPGQLSEPVQTAFGWHLILVTEVRQRSFEDAQRELVQEQGQAASQQLQSLLTALIRRADITVNPRYGRFSTEELRIIPPEAPVVGGTTTTLLPQP